MLELQIYSHVSHSLFTLFFLSRNFAYKKCKGNIGEAVEQDEELCDEVETVMKFTYLGDRVTAGGGCEAAVTAITRCE